jgi:type IV pilus biogenesis protein CpaD/CtpE
MAWLLCSAAQPIPLHTPGWAYLCLLLAVAALLLLVLCAGPAQPLALRDDVHTVAGLQQAGTRRKMSAEGAKGQQGLAHAYRAWVLGALHRLTKAKCLQQATQWMQPLIGGMCMSPAPS